MIPLDNFTKLSEPTDPRNPLDSDAESEGGRGKKRQRTDSGDTDTPMANGTLPTNFTLPDPFQLTTPTNRDLNPHIQKAGEGDIPTLPPVSTTQFTRAEFPRVVIPFDDLVRNLAEEQVNQIKGNPGNYIAIIPFGAGKKFYDENPTSRQQILKMLVGFGFSGNEELELAAPIPRTPNKNRKFEGPWPMLLKNASAELRAYLLWQQTFAVKADVAFNAISFDMSIQSWVIMNITGDAIADTERRKKQVMGTIKSRLWQDQAIRDEMSTMMAIGGATNCSINELVFRATATYELTFIDAVDAQGQPNPIFQLTGRPLTSNEADHHRLLAQIRCPAPPGKSRLPNAKSGKAPGNNPFPYITPDGHLLKIGKTFVNCIWCKAGTHPAHKCPFLAVDDWRGPRHDAASERREDLNAVGGSSTNSNQSNRRGGSSSRGQRGGRGAGARSGKWTTVRR